MEDEYLDSYYESQWDLDDNEEFERNELARDSDYEPDSDEELDFDVE